MNQCFNLKKKDTLKICHSQKAKQKPQDTTSQEVPPVPEEDPLPEEDPVPEEDPLPEADPVPEEDPVPQENTVVAGNAGETGTSLISCVTVTVKVSHQSFEFGENLKIQTLPSHLKVVYILNCELMR